MSNPGNLLYYTRIILDTIVSLGDRVIDATCGNGHDTFYLAEKVGKNGHVYAFDIQDEALRKTKLLVNDKGFSDRVTLIKADHRFLTEYVSPQIDVIIFNLGYLPGENHSLTTTIPSTIPAIRAGLSLLKINGTILIVAYKGHDEGKEASAVQEFLKDLPANDYACTSYNLINRDRLSPVVYSVTKLIN